MPRDIRSYFSNVGGTKATASAPTSKTKKRRVISSDEEVAKVTSPVKRQKVTQKAKKHHVLSDSDEDVTTTRSKTVANPKEEEAKKPLKMVTPKEMFGDRPVRRQKAPVVSKRQKLQEADVHKDEDFEATLEQLDTSKIEEDYLASMSHSDANKNGKDDKPTLSPKKKKLDEDVSSNGNGNLSLHKKMIDTKEEKVEHVKPNNTSNDRFGKKKSKDKRKDTTLKQSSSTVDKEKDSTVHTKRKSSNDSNEGARSKSIDDDTSPMKRKSKGTPKKISTIAKVEIEEKKTMKKKSPEKQAVDVFEERIEKKKQSSALYQQYLQRGGARNPGSKEIPEGAEYCLAGLSFLITGVLDSLEREEADELIKKYGGRILQQVSKKTNYVIVGDEPGPAKLAKAESLNVKKITEDGLLEMIRTRPPGKATNVVQSHTKSTDRSKRKSPEPEPMTSPSPKKGKQQSMSASPKKPKLEIKEETKDETDEVQKDNTVVKTTLSPQKLKYNEEKRTDIKVEKENVGLENTSTSETLALVDKYRPKNLKQILGQQGDKSSARKLHFWLQNWHKNRNGSIKHVKPSPWAKNDDGAFFKAALLSGPPGIGKTTTAQIACNELGFDLLEFNASDTRSKRLLKEEVTEILSNTTMKGYFSKTHKKPTSNHVLIMDEVDGMAGNEDRGGLQELIQLIKSTDIPIICICNDRNNPKMKTLANYTFELKFQKPRLEQIRGAMMSICFKENIQISKEDLERLIESTNQDIRQVINHLSMLVGNSSHVEKTNKKHANKDLKLGPWDVVRQVFSAEDHKSMSIHDKCDLFFHDYNIAGLFVQENYLSVTPNVDRSELMQRVAQTAESLAIGDMIEKSIRSNGAWSLLPVQACFSSVIPGSLMSGHITSQILFPAWLGRNSKARKFDRLMQEITVHARLASGVSKEAMNIDCISHLKDAIVRPLVTEGVDGVDKAVEVMKKYHLLREDLDSLVEVSLWPNQRDPMQSVDSKVKAAFTRAYNKNCISTPYSIQSTFSKKKGGLETQDSGFGEIDEEEGNNSEEEEDSVQTDKMIKAKKPTASKKAEPVSKGENSKGKGKKSEQTTKRGRGRGKAK